MLMFVSVLTVRMIFFVFMVYSSFVTSFLQKNIELLTNDCQMSDKHLNFYGLIFFFVTKFTKFK